MVASPPQVFFASPFLNSPPLRQLDQLSLPTELPPSRSMAETAYLRKLVAAADFVLARDQDAPTLDPLEFGVSAVLKPHQIEGASWLVRRFLVGANAVIGDEMGLGKTLQAISFLNYVNIKFSSTQPSLILCPLSVTDGWSSEFAKFCPALNVFKYVGDKEFRRGLRGMLCEYVQSCHAPSDEHLCLPFDILLTTYDIALLDQDFLSQIPWQICVVDEAQRLKNPSSVLYNVLENRFLMPRRILMTGTPIQNNLSELWSLMHFCLPSIFGTLEQFLSAFKEVEVSPYDYDVNEAGGRVKILKHILNAFLLRRTKNTLIESGTLVLPRLTELTVLIPLAPLQRKVYVSILRRELQKLLTFSSGAVSHQSLQNTVIQLRKACSHPYLFNGIEPEPFEEGEHLIQASGKLIFLDFLLKRLKASGHRVLLFAQMTHTLDILQDFLELRKYTYERLDGSVRAEERFAAIRSFSIKQTKDKVAPENQPGAFVFMISTRAGGVGLNLVAADTVIFYEQDWNPQVDKQALQRAHRIGQTSDVLAISLVTEHTVEEIIMRRAQKKLQLTNKVVGESSDFHEAGKIGPEDNDMRSLIFGLRFFDPNSINNNIADDLDVTKLNKMTDKVLEMRYQEQSNKGEQKFEVNSADFFSKGDLAEKCPTYIELDPEVDESAYQSWIEKFKEASQSIGSQSTDIFMERKRRSAPLNDEQKLEKERQAKEKRFAKWEALGYKSLAVEVPVGRMDSDIISDSGQVRFVYGDCTKPTLICSSEPALIFSCVDNSGVWGRGGMFNSLSDLSDDIPGAYHRAAEFKDLHLGDLHLIKIRRCLDVDDTVKDAPLWVALGVVQSYSRRRKIPRSDISIDALDECLLKASFSAAQNSASLHMPRIGYQDGSQRSEWYTIERLLRKYSSIYGVEIYVHYFRRSSNGSSE